MGDKRTIASEKVFECISNEIMQLKGMSWTAG